MRKTTAIVGCGSAGLILATALVLLAGCSQVPESPAAAELGGQRSQAQGLPSDSASPAPAEVASTSGAAVAIAEARALRQAGDKTKAAALLEKASKDNPRDRVLMTERGMLALELGRISEARSLLKKAQDPQAPDWRVHSALGAALASAGKQQEAQLEFAKALELAPDHPSILNNLALSYVLDGKPEQAEPLLRRVAASQGSGAQVKQNLALVLGLGGKFGEAEKVAAASLPKEQASANVAYLRSLAEPGPKSAASEQEPTRTIKSARASEGVPQPTYQLGAPRDGARDH